MSIRREHSLDSLLGEIAELKERMRQAFPSYIASLKELSSLPEEFECRFWASRVDALLQVVKADYENFQARAQKVDFLGKFMTLGIDVALKAGGMEPIAPPPSVRIGISISPSGKIEPALFDDPNRQPNVIFITFEELEAIARRLKEEMLKGTVMLKEEDEIPRLIYKLALERE